MSTASSNRTRNPPKTVEQALRAADAKRIVVAVTPRNADADFVFIWVTKAEAKRLLGIGERFEVVYRPSTRSLMIDPPTSYSDGIRFEVAR